MTRYWPVWGIAVFFALIIPFGHLMKIVNYKREAVPFTLSTSYGLYVAAVNFIPLMMFIYTILVAMATWSYLFSTRSVSLMHSIPVNRNSLFFTNVLSALTMLVGPLVLYGVLYELIDIYLGSGDVCALLHFWAISIGESLILFAVATLSAMITGNLFALPIIFVVINYLASGLEVIIEFFATGYIYGYTGNYKGVLEFLSPLVFLTNKIEYDFLSEQKTQIYGTPYALIYGLVGIVLLILCGLIYSKRRSEAAGETICVPFLKPFFTVIFSGSVAILLGRLLYYIFGYNSFYYQKTPITLLVLFSGVVGYFGATMILRRTLSVFNKKSLIGLLVTLSSLLVICILSSLDIFQLEDKIPEQNEIALASVSYSNCNFEITDSESLELVRALHKSFIDDKEFLSKSTNQSNMGYYACIFVYTLKDGSIVERTYPMGFSSDKIEAFACKNSLQEFFNNPHVILQNIEDMKKKGSFTYASIWGDTVRGYSFDDPDEIKVLCDALEADVRSGTYFYSVDYDSEAVFIEFEIMVPNSRKAVYYKFALTDDMTETNSVLNKYGWTKKEFAYAQYDDEYVIEE